MRSTAARAAGPPAALGFSILLLAAPPASASRHAAPPTIAAVSAVAGDSIPLTGHVVYLDFWASWCVPCRSSFPWMAGLLARYRDRGLEVVTVDLDKDPAAARRFLAATNSSLPVIPDPKGRLAEEFHLRAMPTSFVFGRDGRIRARHEGFYPEDTDSLESRIAGLLGEGTSR